MAEDNVQANIRIGIDTSDALVSIKNLQRQISAFHTSMANGSAANAAAASNFQKTLIDNINATKKFSASVQTVKTTTETFTNSLEKNKLSIGQYFRYAGGASKSFGRLFTTEFETINKVARERVKDLQTQYIRMGRDANGAMRAIAVRPLVLDMDNLATKTAIAAQRQQLLNQLLKQGSTNLLNFGKNTQWAGRQLMVGFTIPLSIFGATAAKSFMAIEDQAIRFKRVYGDLMTDSGQTDAMLESIKTLASEFTKYGVAVDKTMGLAASAAAQGKTGADLTAQVSEATRLAVLGQVEQQQALETTISVTNAFGTAAEDLASKIDFLNAVENQTVTSIEDLTIAIPKAGPVVKQLGGDVEDLAFFLTAMKEGGINASEGANALKSGLASLINPTEKASGMLAGFGININKIVESNKGDVKGIVIDFASALDKLDPLKRARAIEQLFGKFQFSRLSTLFQNVIGEGTQAQKVLDLAATSSQDLAALSSRELGKVSESSMFKFKKSIEDIKVALAPIGEIFLKLVTPVIEFGTKILDAFNRLDEKTKSFVTGLVAVVGGIGPVLLMTFGLLANGIANIIKGFTFVKNVFNKASVSSSDLGSQISYMTSEQLTAAAVASSLDQVHGKLTQTFTSEAGAVNAYTEALKRAAAASAAFNVPAVGRARPGMKMASGGFVPGSGNGDTVPAMLTPGEFVVKKSVAQKVMPMLEALNSGKIPGFAEGGVVPSVAGAAGSGLVRVFGEFALRLQDEAENMAKAASSNTDPERILAPLSMRIGEARGIVPSQSKVKSGAFDQIGVEYESLVQKFTDNLNSEFETTFKNIKNSDDRFEKAWLSAGQKVEQEVAKISSDVDRGVVRKTFGLDPDFMGTIPTMPRREGGTKLERARKSAFNFRETGVRSYNTAGMQKGTKELFEKRTGQSASKMQMGHAMAEKVFVPMQNIIDDPKATNAAKKAGEFIGIKVTENAAQGIKDSTRQASPSKEAYNAGVNIGKGAIQGIESTIDDAQRAGRKNRRITAISDGQGGMVVQRTATQSTNFAESPSARTPRRAVREGDLQARQRAEQAATAAVVANTDVVKTNTKTFGSGLRNASYVISGLSGVALMFGQNMGNLTNIVFGASMALSALTTAAEINASTGFLKLGPAAAGSKGISSFFSRMVNIGGKAVMSLGRFAGVVGIAITAISGFVMLANYINDQREKERLKIEGLGDAASLTTKQIETLGNIYGKPKVVTAFESMGTTSGPATAQERADAVNLASNKDFKKDFGQTIDTLRTATNEEAVKTFETLSLSLLAQGYEKDIVQQIINTIRVQAGKTKLDFQVASIDLTTEGGQKNFKDSVAKIVKDFQTEIDKPRSRIKLSPGFVNGKQVDRYQNSDALDKSLETNATNLTERMNSVQTMFNNGAISITQYNSAMEELKNAMTASADSAVLTEAVFKKFTEALPEGDLKTLMPTVQGAGNQFLVMQASMVGTISTADDLAKTLTALNIITKYLDDPNNSGYTYTDFAEANKVIAELTAKTDAATKKQEKLNKATNDYNKGDGTGESAFQKAIKDIAGKTKEIQNQINAFKKLKAAGYDTEKAFTLAKDPILAAALASTKVGSKEWKTLTAAIKESEKAAAKFKKVQRQTLEGATEEFDKAYGNVSEAFSALEEQLQLAFNKANKADLDLISTSESQIAALSYTLDDYNASLDDIQSQEDLINDRYDKRVEALDKVAAANEEISRQQKSQLTIADALTQGDISAAAKAVQDARAESSKSMIESQRSGLELARGSELSGVKSGGKTREEVQKEILSLEQQIKAIEESSLEPAQERVRLAEEKLASDTAALKVGGLTKLEWETIANNVKIAKTNTDEFKKSIDEALAAATNLSNVLAGLTTSEKSTGEDKDNKDEDKKEKKKEKKTKTVILDDTPKTTKIAPNRLTPGQLSAKLGGTSRMLAFSSGGIVPKYFASGGYARGTDTVPAMLTPGEFVVKKYAVKEFGLNNLKSINNGTSAGNSVYNYDLSVNMSGTNLNADDVAQAVISKIKKIDSQRIRGNTF